MLIQRLPAGKGRRNVHGLNNVRIMRAGNTRLFFIGDLAGATFFESFYLTPG